MPVTPALVLYKDVGSLSDDAAPEGFRTNVSTDLTPKSGMTKRSIGTKSYYDNPFRMTIP